MRIDFDLIVRVNKENISATGPVQTDELLKVTIAGPRVAVDKVMAAIKKVAELV